MNRDSIRHRRAGGRKWRLKRLRLALLAGALALIVLLGFNCGETETVPDIVETATPVVGDRRFSVAVWADAHSRWQFGDLYAEDSRYREGQAIPFLLRMDDLRPGAVYVLFILYGCGAEGTAAFDFLTAYGRDSDTELTTAEEGPGRAGPDASIPIPDDPSIRVDDEGREPVRLFHLWGANFDSEPIGPILTELCKRGKVIGLRIRAAAPAVYLLWAGHLGSSTDWGEGQGAAGGDGPFEIEVRVPGVDPGSVKLEIASTAVSP